MILLSTRAMPNRQWTMCSLPRPQRPDLGVVSIWLISWGAALLTGAGSKGRVERDESHHQSGCHRRFFFTFTSHTEPTPAAPTHRHANRAAQIPFKLIGRRIEQEDTLLDYICGHAPATVGRGYGEPTLKDLAQVI